MNNKKEIDARDLEIYKEEKPLSSKIDDIAHPLLIKYYPVKGHRNIDINLVGLYPKNIDELRFSQYLYEISPSSGTGEIKEFIVEGFFFKEKLTELDKKLREYSEGIVGLGDNWDGKGTKAITIESWNDATALLREILYDLWYNGFNVSIPLVLPNTDGNFDINWETEEFELIITLPSKRNELVHIYGERSGRSEYELEVRINFELAKGVIAEWMKKIL